MRVYNRTYVLSVLRHSVPYFLNEIRMTTFQADGSTFSVYLAEPPRSGGSGVQVFHAWWGLTEPFWQDCDEALLCGSQSVIAARERCNVVRVSASAI